MESKKLKKCIIPMFGSWQECPSYKRTPSGYCYHFIEKDYKDGACLLNIDEFGFDLQDKHLEDDLFQI